jgi:hypothetical protein
MKKTSKKHYCEECGKKLSKYEQDNFGDLCNECYEFLME